MDTSQSQNQLDGSNSAPGPAHVAASAREMRALLKKYHQIDMPANECVRAIIALESRDASQLTDPVMLVRLGQLFQAQAAERGMPRLDLEAACKGIEQQFYR